MAPASRTRRLPVVLHRKAETAGASWLLANKWLWIVFALLAGLVFFILWVKCKRYRRERVDERNFDWDSFYRFFIESPNAAAANTAADNPQDASAGLLSSPQTNTTCSPDHPEPVQEAGARVTVNSPYFGLPLTADGQRTDGIDIPTLTPVHAPTPNTTLGFPRNQRVRNLGIELQDLRNRRDAPRSVTITDNVPSANLTLDNVDNFLRAGNTDASNSSDMPLNADLGSMELPLDITRHSSQTAFTVTDVDGHSQLLPDYDIAYPGRAGLVQPIREGEAPTHRDGWRHYNSGFAVGAGYRGLPAVEAAGAEGGRRRRGLRALFARLRR